MSEHTKAAAACRLWAIFLPGNAPWLNKRAEHLDAVAAALNEMVEGPVHTQADRPTNEPEVQGGLDFGAI